MRRRPLFAIVPFLLIANSLCADELLVYVVQAFAAEEQAVRKRSRLRYVNGARESRYTITRVLPDRLHFRDESDQHQHEMYIIGDRLYEKVGGAWQTGPALRFERNVASAGNIVRHGVENLVERAPINDQGQQLRVFAGEMSWLSGGVRNAGEIEIRIVAATHLPTLVAFRGRCGGTPCSFEQTFSYEAGIVVDQPVP